MKKGVLLAILLAFLVFISLSFIGVKGYRLALGYNTGDSIFICYLPIITKGQSMEVDHMGQKPKMEYHFLPTYQPYADTVCDLNGIE